MPVYEFKIISHILVESENESDAYGSVSLAIAENADDLDVELVNEYESDPET